jgi:hypothetical protein
MTTHLHVAAIDPGVTTGLAIAHLVITDAEVVIKRQALLSTTNPLSVVSLVCSQGCDSVILEKRPANASQEGTENYEKIFNQLILSDKYYRAVGFWLIPEGICQILPGLWKPYMKTLKGLDLGSWEPTTQHEQDALALLYYVTKLNHMSKDVQYG